MSFDVALGERDTFHLAASKHRGLIVVERRVLARALAVGEHGIRARNVAELHRERTKYGLN